MIFRLVLFAVSVSLVAVLIKENYKTGAVMLTISVCIYFFSVFSGFFSSVRDEFTKLGNIEGLDNGAMIVIVKALAVAYLTGFGCDICTDVGEKAIANALEVAGKAIMFSMALPMLFGIFNSIRDIMGG